MNSRWFDSALPAHGAPPRTSQRLVAVPYRHAGLIALCTLVGALAAAVPPLQRARAPLVSTAARVPAPRLSSAIAGPIGLRLDLEPGFAALPDGARPATDGLRRPDAQPGHAPALRLDGAHGLDAIDIALSQAPPAAGRVAAQAFAVTAAADGGHSRLAWPGLAAGLLLGLLVAAVRELRGQRMRSPREAEWALGAPVLAAIPTLSARARAALLAPPNRP